VKQCRLEPIWPGRLGKLVDGQEQRLVDLYFVWEYACADEGSTGVEAMLQALHFYYRMHNDLSYEVKMLGIEGVWPAPSQPPPPRPRPRLRFLPRWFMWVGHRWTATAP
jgi:hypothetical protein